MFNKFIGFLKLALVFLLEGHAENRRIWLIDLLQQLPSLLNLLIMSSFLPLEVVIVSILHILVHDLRGQPGQLRADEHQDLLVCGMEGEDAADEFKSNWELWVVATDEVGLSAADDLMIV